MIRLVGQFDKPKARVTVATPTCGCACCCCCCSCVATVLTSSIITARNFGRAVNNFYQEKQALDTDKSKLALERNIARILGFSILPISIILVIALFFILNIYKDENIFIYMVWALLVGSTVEGLLFVPILIFAFFYASALFLFRLRYKLEKKQLIVTMVLTGGGLIVEFFAWLFGILFIPAIGKVLQNLF